MFDKFVHRRSPIRVLQLAGGLNLDAGGPARSVPNSVLACLGAGLEVTLAIPDRDPQSLRQRDDVRQISACGGRLEVFPLTASDAEITKRYGVSVPLFRYIRSQATAFEVVHLRGAWLAGSLLVALDGSRRCGDRRGPLVVLSPHETLTRFDLAQSRSPVTRTLKRWARAVLERGVDAVVYSSELEREDSGHEALWKQAFVVHHPVAVPEEMAVAECGNGVLRVGFLGRFHAKKNLSELILAVARLPEAVRIEVAGMGAPEEAERLRRLAGEAGLGERVRWRGFVDGEAKTAFLRGLDLLAMPSAYECFGMAAAEALAHGVPVVVGEQVGVAPVVRRYGCGLVVRPDAEPIAAALKEALLEPGRLAAMAARAAVAAKAEFSFEAHGTALRRVYEELASQRHRGVSALGRVLSHAGHG